MALVLTPMMMAAALGVVSMGGLALWRSGAGARSFL